MHELGIVFYIIDDVRELAAANDASRVRRVKVELGEVSGVVPELLEDAWHWACKREPVMDGCALELVETPAVTLCESCGERYRTVEFGRSCPACGSDRTQLLQGREVTIVEIEVEEGP